MRSLVVFVCFIGASMASPHGRIVNGNDAAVNSWPWQLSLQFLGSSESYSHICGAAVLSNNYAVTAAHCVDHDLTVSKYRILAGANNFEIAESSRQDVGVNTITMHPEYSSGNGGFPHDIAVLKLDTPLNFTDAVKPATLPDSDLTSYFNGRLCFITGWGRLSGGGSLPSILQEAETTVIGYSSCRSALGFTGLLYLNEAAHICVYDNESGACNGDSGGPLVCDVNGVWQMAGVTSWGLQNCPVSSPSVYTRLSSYAGFIAANTDVAAKITLI